MENIEVCLSPVLFAYKTTTDNFVVVVIDVLRATTAFCAAFDSGVKSVIPVSGLTELLEYKNKGFLTAAERDGKKVDFADFGNSPSVFLQNSLKGKELAYSTTNGTQAIEMAKSCGNIVAASFVNIGAVGEWLAETGMNVVILCSGWKNSFSLEDTLCAGALIEKLDLSGQYAVKCDAAFASLQLWLSAKDQLVEIVKNASHYQRLTLLGHQNDLKHCFTLNSSKVVPVWDGRGFTDISGTKKLTNKF